MRPSNCVLGFAAGIPAFLLLMMTMATSVHAVLLLEESSLQIGDTRPSCLHSHLGILEANRVEEEILRLINSSLVSLLEKHKVNETQIKDEKAEEGHKSEKKSSSRYSELRVEEQIEYTVETVEELLREMNKIVESRELEALNTTNKKSDSPFHNIINTFHFARRLTQDTRQLIQRIESLKTAGRVFRNLFTVVKETMGYAFCSISEAQLTAFKQDLVIAWEVNGQTFEDLLAGRVLDQEGKYWNSLREKVSMDEVLSLLPSLCHLEGNSYPVGVLRNLCLRWSDLASKQWAKELSSEANKQVYRSFTRQYARSLCEAKRCKEGLALLTAFQEKYGAVDKAFCRPVERDIASLKELEERIQVEASEDSTEEKPLQATETQKLRKLLVEQFYTNYTSNLRLSQVPLTPESACIYYTHPRQPFLKYKVEVLNKRRPTLYHIHGVVTGKEVASIKETLSYEVPNLLRQKSGKEFFYQENQAFRRSSYLSQAVKRIDLVTRPAVQPDSRISSTVLIRNTAFVHHVPLNLFRHPRKKLYEEVQGSTSLMFLSDTVAGGQVFFPELKLAVRPQQGSVLFWYDDISEDSSKVNLHEPIDVPLLVGSKWMAVRRIEEVSGGTCAK